MNDSLALMILFLVLPIFAVAMIKLQFSLKRREQEDQTGIFTRHSQGVFSKIDAPDPLGAEIEQGNFLPKDGHSSPTDSNPYTDHETDHDKDKEAA